MQRESAAVEARRVRKAVDGIAKWQQVGYDLVNPSGERYRDAPTDGRRATKTAIHRFKMECFGGAGASMGLRQIFKRFDANGDGSLSRDELRLALEGRNRDVTRFEDFWAALDRDHDGRVTLLELARAIADDREDCAPLVADTSAAPAGETSPWSATAAPRRRRHRRVAAGRLRHRRALGARRRAGGAAEPEERTRRLGRRATTEGDQRRLPRRGRGRVARPLRSIFRRFDASGDGVIQRDELRKGLSIAGVDFSQGAYDEVMAEMDIDHDGAVSLPEFAHAICGGMDFGDSEHAYYREQRRPPKSLDALRDDFVAVPVSVLADVSGGAVDVTAADLAALAPGGTLAMDALYAALFGDGEVGHRATPEPSPYW
ncbi:Ca2-binding protein [Aureococcus anophagefferens]|nr:Ca2-binding protein [Aureococcus anophagefferens]